VGHPEIIFAAYVRATRLLGLIGFVIGWEIIERVGGIALDWIKALLHSGN